jgi:DtxR family transcriptional regulator, Mn-dependent transcriptional regulator
VAQLHKHIEAEEEALATIWIAIEQDESGFEEICQRNDEMPTLLSKLLEDGFLSREGDTISFTDAGHESASQLVRRNRLAEVLLEQVLDVSPEGTAYTACLWEHHLTQEVTDNICTFLGHPRQCPHGKPIPTGDCCHSMSQDVTPLVQPLTSLRVGGHGRITFIAPKVHKRLDRLAALGIVPGTSVLLRQKSPSYVLRAGETEIAIESAVAADIFVRETSPDDI